MDAFNILKNFFVSLLRPSSRIEEEQRIKGLKAPRFLILLSFGFSFLLALGIGGFFLDRYLSKNEQPKFIGRTSPQNIPEAKVQSTMQTPCITQNNFEDSIWEKKNSLRILSRYGDTGEPEFYGAKTEEPFQSQMIYPFNCPLPFSATVSFVSRGNSSIGFQFEYEGVFQVILGDGDRRAIRYKADTQGTRLYGWEYIKKEGKKITHWIPEDVKPGTEIEVSISAKQNRDQIEMRSSVKYYSEKDKKYVDPINFDPVVFKVESFDPSSGVGRQIRVGINDVEFKGTQAAIKFLHFSLKQE